MSKIEIDEREYNALKRDSQWLSCLEQAGVDNWEGYDMAQDMMSEDDDEE